MNSNMNKTDFIVHAEGICFRNGWTAENVKALMDDPDCVCTVEDGTGYAIGRISFDEAELYRIAVLPGQRRQHAGERILRDFIMQCSERGAEKIFLEVRSRNEAAVGLYEKNGFERISVRRGYYGDDDALIYLFTVSNSVNGDLDA